MCVGMLIDDGWMAERGVRAAARQTKDMAKWREERYDEHLAKMAGRKAAIGARLALAAAAAAACGIVGWHGLTAG